MYQIDQLENDIHHDRCSRLLLHSQQRGYWSCYGQTRETYWHNSPGLQDLDFRVDFFCLLSLDGGTGSALLLLEKLSTDYGKKSKSELCVLHLSCVVELSQ